MRRFLILLGSLALCATPGGASEPTPTPPPSSLARLAAGVELDRSALGDGTGTIVISNENLGDLAAAGRLTTAPGVESTPGPAAQARPPRDETALRERWRASYRRQQERVLALEEQLARLELEVAAAEEADRNRPPGRARRPDRAPPLRQRREALTARLERERSELRRIVRRARADGAQPGWFR